MAKDVIFESEKFEKRQKLKRFLIPAIVLAVILVIVIVIALILGGKKGESHSEGAGTDYPYTWTENQDGSVTLLLPLSKAEGYDWGFSNLDPSVVEVALSKKQPKGQKSFTLTPLSRGVSILDLSLNGQNPEVTNTDTIFSLSIRTSVLDFEGTLMVRLDSGNGRSLPGVIRGGEAEGRPYEIYMEDEETLIVRIKDDSTGEDPNKAAAETADLSKLPLSSEQLASAMAERERETEGTAGVSRFEWTGISSNEAVFSARGTDYEDGYVTAVFDKETEAGEAELRIYSGALGAEVVVTVKVEENGSVRILSHRTGSFDWVPDYTGSADEITNPETAATGS